MAQELKIFGTKTKKFSRVFSRKHEAIGRDVY
nr:DUF1661 domain-containing protein [Porphyromonas gingivalis]